MNERIQRLRKESFEATPCISIERALIETEFYKKHLGKHSTPVLRALAFKELCAKKTLYIGEDELIVGERGPFPKSVSTFPELTCHTAEDLRILNNRAMTRFKISDADIDRYAQEVVPFWQGRSMRDRVFSQVPEAWAKAYRAGLFTEFMEQRAAGPHHSGRHHLCVKACSILKRRSPRPWPSLDYLEGQRGACKRRRT